MYVVGKVLKPQGIKGELKVEVVTSFPEHFNELEELYLADKNKVPLKIESVRLAEGVVFIKFEGVHSRSEADLLRNEYLYISEKDLYPLQKDEFYSHQLVGLYVFSENGERIGIVENVENYPANDVLVVKSQKGEYFMIPAVKEIIKEIDIKSGKVIIVVLEGLLS